jgi:hypothetical protein
MWTTSNSRADLPRLPATVALLVLLGCSPAGSAPESPDAPRPARDLAGQAQPIAPAGAQVSQDRPVELRSARPLAVRGDTLLERLAGQAFLRQARSPLAIEVITLEPLGELARTASPEIYLDGVRVGDTWPLPPNRLVVFLPDAGRLQRTVSVTVAWLGSEERTRSRRPVVLTEEQLRPFR